MTVKDGIITEFVKKAIKNDEFCTIDICLTWDAKKYTFSMMNICNAILQSIFTASRQD